ncbi:LytTR family DNA-binding domain-containing protein [Pelagerythrobacter aerophilus]
MTGLVSLPQSRPGWIAFVLSGWVIVAVVQAAQGSFLAAHAGTPQQWWPTLAYTLAIYSVWALLTWPVAAAIMAIERAVQPRALRIAAYLALWPVVSALHVLVFAGLYWPAYRGEGVPTRWAMADRMFVRNLDTNTLLYFALLGIVLFCLHLRRRQRAAANAASSAPDNALLIRSRGHIRRIPLDTIDWIGAAGDYVEVHVAGSVELLDESLASLAARLPAEAFARIHRGALVRLDRIRNIEPIGRGDAHVRLVTGERLRLSRRFRANLAPLIAPA